MTALGEFALWIALPVSFWGMAMGFVGGHQKRGDLVLSAERSVYLIFALLFVASLGVVNAFLTDQFQYWYVANYSNRQLDPFFKLSGLWAGQRGSLLFWAVLLAFFSAVCVFLNRHRNREFMPYVVGILQGIIGFFVVVLLFAGVNPFEQLGFVPADGAGLNPQLQNYWMTIHPPVLYLGFTAFSIPFAFAMAALLTGRTDSRWIVLTRRWTLLSWFFLANGIIFGMRWAYEELGWGGYWFWDPVENASLLPWLTATAFLHSIMIQENRGMLKVWNMSLVLLTFLLTIFATFLTRSGLIESVHSFAENTQIALIFLAFMGSIFIASVVLIVYRLPDLKSENQIQSFLSREAAFLFNNLIFLGAAFAVLWGTMFPLISEAFTGEQISVGPPFFNRVNIPIGLGLLALTGIGPVIAWRRATRRNLKRNFAIPVAVGAVVVGVFWGLGARNGYALATFGISAFVLTIIFVEFWKGTKARARIEGEGILPALAHLVGRNRRRWGGYIVHVGVVLIFTAFAGRAFEVEVRETMNPGETVSVASPFGHTYTLTYEGMSSSRDQNFDRWAALMSVQKNGETVGALSTERRFYRVNQQMVTEVGIRSTPMEDLYVILADVEDFEGMVANDPDAQRIVAQV
ncbi:MAG: heme lyase CcmF/NrfE family subunit, partial [Gemmatimonadetes bacterium]|nr:heme lyase CcmF/NrfE family subunit [Gemmatimonadota bacterium]